MFKMFKYPGDSAMIKMTVRWQFAKCIQVLQHCQEAWNLFWKPDEKLTKGFQAAVLRTVGAKMSRQCLGVCGDVRSVVSSMEDSSNLHKSRLHTVLVWPSRDIQCASMHFHAFSIFNILQHPSTSFNPEASHLKYCNSKCSPVPTSAVSLPPETPSAPHVHSAWCSLAKAWSLMGTSKI